MNRIDSLFEKLRKEKRKAFVAYIVAGDPNLEKTTSIVLSLEKAGADIIELGIPFSDPLADGAVNQLGSQRALDSGTTLQSILKTVETIRASSQIPIVFFTYYNPIFKFGLTKFLQEAERVGVDGVLILDLPPEEAAREWPSASSLKRITLVAPTTPLDRIAAITAHASGFIYYVSREGVTGMQNQVAVNLSQQIDNIRTCTKLPICVGFGISNPDQASSVAAFADGVVVGSAIVNQIAQHGTASDLPDRVAQFVRPLTQAVHA